MKRSILLFSLLLIGIVITKAQKISSTNALTVSIGPSLPVGDYGSKNIQNNGSGFASTGGSVAINYYHLLSKKIGFSVSLQGQLNPLASNKLEESFNDLLIADITVWAGTNPGQIPPPATTGTKYPNWNFDKKSWWTASCLIGIYGEFPLGGDGKTEFLANIAFGPSYITAPSIKGSSIGTAASAYHEQSGGKAWGLGFDVNAGVKRYLKDKLFLQFLASHYAAPSVSFKDITASTTLTKGQPGDINFFISKSMRTGTGEQSINSLNFLFGIGFSF